jgi:hypothetical protein
MTTINLHPGTALGSADHGAARTPDDRDLLHQAAVDLATAQVLERLAERSASPPLAVLLLDRARRRRCRAEHLRAVVGTPTCGR